MKSIELIKAQEIWRKSKKEKNDLINYFSALYNESFGKNDAFLYIIVEIIKSNNLVDLFFDILDDIEVEKGARLISFYIICTIYRRNKDFSHYDMLLSKYQKIFDESSLYWIQKAVYLKSNYKDTSDLHESLRIWKTLEDRVLNFTPILQAYADTVVICFENNCLSLNNHEDNIVLVTLVKKLEKVIVKNKYPKYTATLGKLHAINGNFDLAVSLIKNAISNEDSSRTDYAIKINDYQSYLLEIKMKVLYKNEVKLLDEQKREIIDIKEEVSKSKYDILAFLGFFTAVISFIIGSFTITDGTTFIQRVQLILILCGSIILSFSSLKLILKNFKGYIKDTIIMLVLGMFIIISAIYLIPIIM